MDGCEIVDAVMLASGLDAGNNALKKRAHHSVDNMLRYLPKKNRIAADDLRGRARMWRLT
jgi:hypothetical protein